APARRLNGSAATRERHQGALQASDRTSRSCLCPTWATSTRTAVFWELRWPSHAMSPRRSNIAASRRFSSTQRDTLPSFNSPLVGLAIGMWYWATVRTDPRPYAPKPGLRRDGLGGTCVRTEWHWD